MNMMNRKSLFKSLYRFPFKFKSATRTSTATYNRITAASTTLAAANYVNNLKQTPGARLQIFPLLQVRKNNIDDEGIMNYCKKRGSGSAANSLPYYSSGHHFLLPLRSKKLNYCRYGMVYQYLNNDKEQIRISEVVEVHAIESPKSKTTYVLELETEAIAGQCWTKYKKVSIYFPSMAPLDHSEQIARDLGIHNEYDRKNFPKRDDSDAPNDEEEDVNEGIVVDINPGIVLDINPGIVEDGADNGNINDHENDNNGNDNHIDHDFEYDSDDSIDNQPPAAPPNSPDYYAYHIIGNSSDSDHDDGDDDDANNNDDDDDDDSNNGDVNGSKEDYNSDDSYVTQPAAPTDSFFDTFFDIIGHTSSNNGHDDEND